MGTRRVHTRRYGAYDYRVALRRNARLSAIAALETVVFATLQSVFGTLGENLLYCYVYPIPAAAIVAIVFTSLWARPSLRFWSVTLLIVSLILDAFLIPLQVAGACIPWVFLIIIPAELVTMLSFKIIRIKK